MSGALHRLAFKDGPRPGRELARLLLPLTLTLLLVAVAACQVVGGPRLAAPVEPKAAPTSIEKPAAVQAQQQPATQAYTARLEFAPPTARVGDAVAVAGSGYPPGAEVDLVWYSMHGHYQLDQGTEFIGGRQAERTEVLATLRAGQSGRIQTSFKVPEDFGGAHDVRGRVAGQELSQASLTVMPTFSMSPTAGPVGTLIELRFSGLDWRPNVNTWHLLYDNKYAGFLSAVTTRGAGVARLRATGPVGEHRLSVWRNSFNPTPYLNWSQGPYKDVASGVEFAFNATADLGLIPPRVEDFSAGDNPWPQNTQGPGTLALSVDRGTVGTRTVLRGSALPPNTELGLQWQTMVGNRVSAIGFSEQLSQIGTVTTRADGAFEKDLLIPDDLGGQHRLSVTRGDEVLGSVGLVIQPSVVSVSPSKVRAGEQVKFHLKGVGWTTFDNTYAVNYDNSYVGYVCGFSTNGDVEFSITATGEPGTHLIDFYPTIYKGADLLPRVYSLPQLTYAEDHPGRITPAIRLSIEVTK